MSADDGMSPDGSISSGGSMSKIGRYTVVRKTGSHSVAGLYEAFDPVMNRPVTICLAERPTDPGSQPDAQPLLFDSRRVSSLDHPNIIRVLACEQEDDRPYFVMEKVDGKTLDTIAAGGKVPQAQIQNTILQAAQALDHIHSKGLAHNHLTPEKVVIGADGQTKLDGFEMAQASRSIDAGELVQELAANPSRLAYVAPELLRGDPIDGRADQYSLAAIAAEALAGHPLFAEGTPVDFLCRVVTETPAVHVGQEVPPAVTRVLERALSKSPADRFSSCGGFASALEAAITGRSIPQSSSSAGIQNTAMAAKATMMAPQAYVIPPPGRSRVGLWIGAFVLACVLAVVAGMMLARRPAQTPTTPAPVVAAPVQTPAAPPAPAAAKAKPAITSQPKAARKTAAPVVKTPAPVPKREEKPAEEEAPKPGLERPKPVLQ